MGAGVPAGSPTPFHRPGGGPPGGGGGATLLGTLEDV
jgi:hypothetical protein